MNTDELANKVERLKWQIDEAWIEVGGGEHKGKWFVYLRRGLAEDDDRQGEVCGISSTFSKALKNAVDKAEALG